jgi:RecB family endonuclease NucS
MDDPAEPDPYALDSSGLGCIGRVEEWRDVWPKEAGHLTPWLYKNIGVLGKALGMKLIAVGQEVPVGELRLDIKAEDADGNVVVIENQLERTDYGHLGQCLVYAARLKARTVVRVAKRFRDDTLATAEGEEDEAQEDHLGGPDIETAL